jgi:hypothetical protein
MPELVETAARRERGLIYRPEASAIFFKFDAVFNRRDRLLSIYFNEEDRIGKGRGHVSGSGCGGGVFLIIAFMFLILVKISSVINS